MKKFYWSPHGVASDDKINKIKNVKTFLSFSLSLALFLSVRAILSRPNHCPLNVRLHFSFYLFDLPNFQFLRIDDREIDTFGPEKATLSQYVNAERSFTKEIIRKSKALNNSEVINHVFKTITTYYN